MIQAIALDSDRSALTTLDVFCQRANGIRLLRTFTQGHEAQFYLQHNRVDLVFLETHMPGESGVEFWQAVRQWCTETNVAPPQLVFATAHSEYAQISYELQALDYLLKPFAFERFSLTVQKATDQRSRQGSNPEKSALYRSFRVDYGLVNVNLTDIICVEASGNYCKLYFINQRPLIVRSTMKALLHQLAPLHFMQVHRSYIVAIHRIKAIHNKLIDLDEKQVPLGTLYERLIYKHLDALAYSSQQ